MALPASFGMIVVLDNLSSFPEFYSFVKKPNIPLASTKSCFPSLLSFSLPLLVESFDELQHLENSLQNV